MPRIPDTDLALRRARRSPARRFIERAASPAWYRLECERRVRGLPPEVFRRQNAMRVRIFGGGPLRLGARAARLVRRARSVDALERRLLRVPGLVEGGRSPAPGRADPGVRIRAGVVRMLAVGLWHLFRGRDHRARLKAADLLCIHFASADAWERLVTCCEPSGTGPLPVPGSAPASNPERAPSRTFVMEKGAGVAGSNAARPRAPP